MDLPIAEVVIVFYWVAMIFTLLYFEYIGYFAEIQS